MSTLARVKVVMVFDQVYPSFIDPDAEVKMEGVAGVMGEKKIVGLDVPEVCCECECGVLGKSESDRRDAGLGSEE